MRAPLVLLLLLATCDGPTPIEDVVRPEILEALAPDPVLEGSILEVRGLSLYSAGAAPELRVTSGELVFTLSSLPDDADARRLFLVSGELVAGLGEGTHVLELRITGNDVESDPFPLEVRIALSLPVQLSRVPSGEVFRNDVGVLDGSGIISATEGELTALFSGTFLTDGGVESAIDVTLAVAPLELRDRTRGVVVLTTDLGGLTPGTFTGTIQLVSTLRSGETTQSVSLVTTLHFNEPTLFGVDPAQASLGRILTITGGGFLGGADRPDEVTLLIVSGSFTPEGSTSAEPFPTAMLVPRFVSGSIVELVVEPEVRNGMLVSALFGHARGTFEGTATPLTVMGTTDLSGQPVPVQFALGPIKQVVYVHFIPSFYDSLRRFGLARVAPEVIDGVFERLETIYAPYNVEFRREPPDDFAATAYSEVEIGGPDPNGAGLFGYDNTPGKDVGNLRLFDAIGGENAQTQMDGYPGYGGVFMDSFLYWSSHPDLPGERPPGAPDPDPLFDEVFDPVRTTPAARDEAAGIGEATRVAAVQRALRALASIVGETTGHEIGHSLGLAQPYGSPTAFHNDFDGEGCIMDSGRDRLLGERMQELGYPTTTWCYDEPEYLMAILGR